MPDLQEKLRAIREAVSRYGLVVTAHADEEAREEDIALEDIREAIRNGEIIEDYPAHRRGPCCLVYALISSGRNLHLVITAERTPPRVITVYEPKSPYWVTPRQRGAKR